MKNETTFLSILFEAIKLTFKVLWQVTKFIVRHTPKAVVTVAKAKRELTDTLVNEYQNIQKHIREEELNAKIRALKGRKNV
jgi:alpha-ketoglutarate-dependent taurine dioxygenase